MPSDIVPAYLRWAFLRAGLARGWWIVTAVHLVVAVRLGPAQLVLVGVFQGLTVLVAEVPAGVLADTTGRRLALVLSHVVRGSGMALTPLVDGYAAIVVTQCLWGLGWALSSGADVAWITDELDHQRRSGIDRVIVAAARWDLLGQVAGIVVVGATGAVVGREAAMVAAGVAMVAQAATVARWPEDGFTPMSTGARWRPALAVLREGLAVARVERVVAVVLVATVLFDGGSEAPGRLREQHLLGLGLPAVDPVVWFTGVAVASAALGALALRLVGPRLAQAGTAGGAAQVGALAGATGAAGVLVFALAPDAATATAGSVLFAGGAAPVARAVGTILVNRCVVGRARATVHSLVSQAEHGGEMAVGLVLAGVAGGAPVAALVASAVLVGCAGAVLGLGAGRGRRPQSGL